MTNNSNAHFRLIPALFLDCKKATYAKPILTVLQVATQTQAKRFREFEAGNKGPNS